LPAGLRAPEAVNWPEDYTRVTTTLAFSKGTPPASLPHRSRPGPLRTCSRGQVGKLDDSPTPSVAPRRCRGPVLSRPGRNPCPAHVFGPTEEAAATGPRHPTAANDADRDHAASPLPQHPESTTTVPTPRPHTPSSYTAKALDASPRPRSPPRDAGPSARPRNLDHAADSRRPYPPAEPSDPSTLPPADSLRSPRPPEPEPSHRPPSTRESGRTKSPDQS
jgi:hypothetical protein